MLENLQANFEFGAKAFLQRRNGVALKKEQTLLATLRRADGMIQGWGKHYRFCNDPRVFDHLDVKASEMIRRYVGRYASTIKLIDDAARRNTLGVETLSGIELKSFTWPKNSAEA